MSARLFSTTFSATRDTDDEMAEIGIINVVILSDAKDDTEAEIEKQLQKHFPETEGWRKQQATWVEITQGLMFGPHRLMWRVEDISEAYHTPDRTMEGHNESD